MTATSGKITDDDKVCGNFSIVFHSLMLTQVNVSQVRENNFSKSNNKSIPRNVSWQIDGERFSFYLFLFPAAELFIEIKLSPRDFISLKLHLIFFALRNTFDCGLKNILEMPRLDD